MCLMVLGWESGRSQCWVRKDVQPVHMLEALRLLPTVAVL